MLGRVTAGRTSTLNRYGELSTQMQQLFNDFGIFDKNEFEDTYLDPFDVPVLQRLQEDIVEKNFETEELHQKFDENILLLYRFALLVQIVGALACREIDRLLQCSIACVASAWLLVVALLCFALWLLL